MAPPRFMAKLRFGVFQVRDEWQLWCQLHQLGRFNRRVDAMSAAERAADQATGSGFDVELHIMSPDGELKLADPHAASERPADAPSHRTKAEAAEEVIIERPRPEPVGWFRSAPPAIRYANAGDA